MLFKLKQTFFLILMLLLIIGCHSKKPMTGMEKSTQYKERLNKKKREENKKSREKARKRQYDIQATSTKERWDINKKKSDNWRKEEFHKKTLSYRIRKFFDNFKREPKPDEGLFSKKQKRRSKGNIFQRIFKRDKKRK